MKTTVELSDELFRRAKQKPRCAAANSKIWSKRACSSCCVEEHVTELRALHRKYRDRPMSLAGTCIVRMAELFDEHVVLTLDSDFTVYRKHSRKPLMLVHP